MNTREELAAGLEQTGQDAARFRWIVANQELYDAVLDRALRRSESAAGVIAYVREGIDNARRFTEASQRTQGRG